MARLERLERCEFYAWHNIFFVVLVLFFYKKKIADERNHAKQWAFLIVFFVFIIIIVDIARCILSIFKFNFHSDVSKSFKVQKVQHFRYSTSSVRPTQFSSVFLIFISWLFFFMNKCLTVVFICYVKVVNSIRYENLMSFGLFFF